MLICRRKLLTILFGILTPIFLFSGCGDDLAHFHGGSSAVVLSSQGTISGSDAEDQNTAYCGDTFPEFDIWEDDPYADMRYKVPDADTVAPFDVALASYEAMIESRPACDTVSGRSTLLVSKEGNDDPRWDDGDGEFDALYDTIQGAIDGAEHCDTIIVRPGVYQEYLRIEGKDVQIYSDTWDEDGKTEDGDERMEDYIAERIDLERYYETGERIVLETYQPYLQPLVRTERTILEGGGYAEGPTLGGILEHDEHEDEEAHVDEENSGCGNRRPMVDFVAGTTRNTVFDGFTVRLMPEQDHTIPGHGHTLQARGGSPVISNNLIYNNGSTGIGAHASWVETKALTPTCAYDSSLEQETFKNEDYRASNVEYRPTPLVYNNISYQNNGLGLGNNHYSNAVMIGNEAFWNQVPGEEAEHQSPGIGNRHGAKTYIAYNIVHENAWVGIAVRQGYLQPADACAEDPAGCNHIDERTQSVILNNIVYNNGFGDTPIENQGGIAVDGGGLPDEPVVIEGNIVFDSKVSGIAVRNEYAGEDRGYVMDDSYALIVDNFSFSNARQGITCTGSDYGTSNCDLVGNETYWNMKGGIGFDEDAYGVILNNTTACNSESGIIANEESGINIYNNISYANVKSGIVDPGNDHDYNILSGNNEQELTCPRKQASACENPQYGSQQGGSGPGNHDLFEDPLFTDALNADFTLQDDSPAIDSGMDISRYYSSRLALGSSLDRGANEM